MRSLLIFLGLSFIFFVSAEVITGKQKEENVLKGTKESDYITGGEANDYLEGGDGDDYIDGAGGWDVLRGDDGDDQIKGGSGGDKLYGGRGNDYIVGDEDEDYIEGGDGDDSIFGGWDNDTLIGGDGHDIMDGGEGNDDLRGGKGEDYLQGGVGDDFLSGEEGDDTYEFSGFFGFDRIYIGNQGDNGGVAIFTQVRPDMLWFRRNGSDLIVSRHFSRGHPSFPKYSQVTFLGWYNKQFYREVHNIFTTGDSYIVDQLITDRNASMLASVMSQSKWNPKISVEDIDSFYTEVSVHKFWSCREGSKCPQSRLVRDL